MVKTSEPEASAVWRTATATAWPVAGGTVAGGAAGSERNGRAMKRESSGKRRMRL
jgi:hypothetical protein